MKFTFRFLLALCLLLLAGDSHLFARTYQEFLGQTTAHTPELKEQFVFAAEQYGRYFVIKSSPYETDKGKGRVEVSDSEDESDDDEVDPFKKCFDSGNYFTTVFCVPAIDALGHTANELLCPDTHFSYLSSCRYITLRVIRI